MQSNLSLFVKFTESPTTYVDIVLLQLWPSTLNGIILCVFTSTFSGRNIGVYAVVMIENKEM